MTPKIKEGCKFEGSLSIPAQESSLSIPAKESNLSEGSLSIPAQEDNPFLDPSSEITIHYGILPHWHQPNVYYFVTFRLADSIPPDKQEQLRNEREQWFNKHLQIEEKPYTFEEKKEYNKLFSDRVEGWLNAGYGSCILREIDVASIMADTLLYFNERRYILDEWVIMPNHVHVLFRLLEGCLLNKICHSWKSYSANVINKKLGRKGQLWMHESYDHIVRNEWALNGIRSYIRKNPEKAGIVLWEGACSWR